MTDKPSNPVVRTTRLHAFPCWEVREYADGMFDAAQVNGPAITAGTTSFKTAVRLIARPI